MSPSCTVGSCQHEVPSYQETTTRYQVILGSEDLQVGHVRAGVWLALCAPDDLPWNREPPGPEHRECIGWAEVGKGFS